jgi:hypothetical protein
LVAVDVERPGDTAFTPETILIREIIGHPFMDGANIFFREYLQNTQDYM